MKVYLAVGHGIRSSGAYDPGAISADGRWSEQKAGDIIVAEAARLLRSWGVTVKDEANQNDPNYEGSDDLAKAWGADLAVAIHHDYSLAPVGAFGHWYHAEAKPIADAIQKAVGEAGFELRPSWHKRRTDLSFIKKHPRFVIYECGRIGQPSLDSAEELRAMGRAIAEGIADYVGVQTTEVDMFDSAARELLEEVHARTKGMAHDLEAMRISARMTSWREAILLLLGLGQEEAARILYREKAKPAGLVLPPEVATRLE